MDRSVYVSLKKACLIFPEIVCCKFIFTLLFTETFYIWNIHQFILYSHHMNIHNILHKAFSELAATCVYKKYV